jgi:hypothetical protein
MRWALLEMLHAIDLPSSIPVMKHKLPSLHGSPSRRHASRWIRAIVRYIGPGFHPDTHPAQYIDQDGNRVFEPAQANVLACDLDCARLVLGARFEQIALHSLWLALGYRFDPQSDQLVRLR